MHRPNISPAEPVARQSEGLRRLLGGVARWFTRLPTRLRLRRAVLCPHCGTDLATRPLYRRTRVCDACGHHFPLPARERIDHLVDPHTLREFEYAIHDDAPRIRRVQRATHLREALVAGFARLAQQSVVIAAFDFRFLGGSMSVAVGEEIARAFEAATERRCPLIAITATGGVRIQEGMPALLQMAKTTQAVQEFSGAGRPFIAVLTNPTTGGVYASFANLADIILAEPDALIGFAGPRVAEALLHEKLPADSHRAEFAYAHGMIDAIVARQDLRATLARILTLTSPTSPLSSNPLSPLLPEEGKGRKHLHRTQVQVPSPAQSDDTPAEILPRDDLREGGGAMGKVTVWETVALARRADRPTALYYVRRLFSDFFELHGDRLHGDDPAIVAGLARFENQSLVVIAQERGRGEERRHGSARPEGYRKAERLIRLAERLRLPIVTFIDTPGADPGYESEQHGIAGAIAHCLAALVRAQVSTVSLIVGEGTSGGALALAVTDRVLILEHATFSVISPEGASVILFGDSTHAAETAERLESRALDLTRGIIDRVVPEPEGGAHTRPDAAAAAVKLELQASLALLQAQADAERLAARRARYRNVGLGRNQAPAL